MLQFRRGFNGPLLFLIVALSDALAVPRLQAGSVDLSMNLDPPDISAPFEPQTFFDYGDMSGLTSDGLLFRVRPSDPAREGHDWNGYPPFVPAPPTPAQDTIALYAGTPLTAILPQFAYKPNLAGLDVLLSRVGNEFFIDATLRRSSGFTATIYGPHEYLLPLGALDAGNYTLTFRLVSSTEGFAPEFTTTGFLSLNVQPVPEPSGAVLAAVGFVAVLGMGRRSRNWKWNRK